MSDRSLQLTLANMLETLGISWPTVVDAALGRVSMKTCDDRLAGWSKAIVERTCAGFEVTGREHMTPGKAYIVMSNHASLYDIPVMFHAIGANMRMITKVELFSIPIFGAALRESGFICIDRKNRKAAIRSLDIARGRLESGTHVWISPEGTRSKTGELLPFKKGGFYLATEGGFPILPATLTGTRDILPAKRLRSSTTTHVHVRLHPVIRPTDFPETPRGRTELMDAVRRSILGARPEPG